MASNLLCVSIIQVYSFHLSNNEIVYEIKNKWGLIMQIGLCTAIKWVLPKIGVPQNGWLIMENPFKMDDLGGFYHPYFWKHPNKLSMIKLIMNQLLACTSIQSLHSCKLTTSPGSRSPWCRLQWYAPRSGKVSEIHKVGVTV